MTRTLSPEMDAWLEHQHVRQARERVVSTARPGTVIQVTVPPCPLTDREIDWLWPRYQACSFPPATFAKRFARTPRENLTARGKNACASIAYRFRRQIFGNGAAKWSREDFLSAVREASKQSPVTTSV